MKRLLFICLFFVTLTVSAQDFILRAGNEVYKYNEATKKWSEKPIPLNTSLNKGDSIKSFTAFTVEVPRTWMNFFSKRVYTFIKYPNGVRLNSNLVEKEDCYALIKTRVIYQSSNSVLVEHLKWVQNNSDSSSTFNVVTELYNTSNWYPINNGDDVSITTSLTLTVFNKEPYNIYVYILWKDEKWESLLNTDECIRISPFSFYELPISLGEPLGHQSALIIYSKHIIYECDIVSLLDGNHRAVYNQELNNVVGFNTKKFNLIK